jgi:hypothetical protein
MTDITTSTPTPARAAAPGPRRWFVAAVSVVLAAGLAALGTFGGSGNNDLGEYLVVVTISALAAVIVFGGVVRHTERSGKYARNGMALSVLAVLSVFVFWTGLPPILGLAGLYLGSQQRDSLGLGAVAVGALAVFGDTVVYFVDVMM